VPQVAPGFRARELIVSIEISDDSSTDEMLDGFSSVDLPGQINHPGHCRHIQDKTIQGLRAETVKLSGNKP
jgi:hypothetical protein